MNILHPPAEHKSYRMASHIVHKNTDYIARTVSYREHAAILFQFCSESILGEIPAQIFCLEIIEAVAQKSAERPYALTKSPTEPLCVRLQRVLPVRKSFLPALVLASMTAVLAPACAAEIAAISPAGPAPIIAIFVLIVSRYTCFIVLFEKCYGKPSC
jgi:hypothetical protein